MTHEELRQSLSDSEAAIAENPNIYAAVVEAMRRRGFAGDDRHVEVLYTIFTSRLLQRPMCTFIKAPSSAGKSWLLNRTLEMFPSDTYEVRSGFSPKAIAYGNSDLRHKILVVQEASGLNGREGNMLVRTLISEGQIRWETTRGTGSSAYADEVKREGPIAFVMTTTHQSMHHEDETRALSLLMDDTWQHTRGVIEQIAKRFAGAVTTDSIDLGPWHAYQRWLAMGPREVVIPFAPALSRLFALRVRRAKRDFEQLLTAIAVSALMHQLQRQRDEAGRVVALINDYVHARRFLDRPLNEACGSAVPPGVRELVNHLMEHSAPVDPYARDLPRGLDLNELATKMNVDKSVAQRRAKKAQELGLAVDLGGGRGRPCRLLPVQTMKSDWNVLPDPRQVEAEMNGMAPPPLPAIIANAPNPDAPDGGYHRRRQVTPFRQAMEELRKERV